MNVILVIVAVIAGLITALFIVAIFTRKSYNVNSEVIINRPKQQVFDYIRILKNQEDYNKWWTMDPKAKKDYVGTDGTIGFTAYWDSEEKKVGKGEQEIKKIIPGERIEYQIRFLRPFKGVSKTFIATETVAGGNTWVKWNFSGTYKYPVNILLLLMDMDKMLGADISTSLNRLKDTIETKNPVI